MFLNTLLVGDTNVSDVKMRDLLGRQTVAKVDYLTSLFNTKCGARADLQIIVEVRNEIAHHFPRPGRASFNLPTWFQDLQRRGLFITAAGPFDFDLGQKLGSYKLAYWTARTILEAVAEIMGDSLFRIAQMHRGDIDNFATMLVGVPEPPSWNGTA